MPGPLKLAIAFTVYRSEMDYFEGKIGRSQEDQYQSL
jgi:hypothetical protein